MHQCIHCRRIGLHRTLCQTISRLLEGVLYFSTITNYQKAHTHARTNLEYPCRLLIIDPCRTLPEALLDALQCCESVEMGAAANNSVAADMQIVALQPTELATRAVHTACAAHPQAPVIAYAPTPSMMREANAFEAGAQGYVVEGESIEQLLAIMIVAHGGGFACCPNALAFMRRELTAPARFSEREVTIANLVAMGGTNAAIAAELGYSVRTVEEEVRRLCRNVGVPSRTGLALWWMRAHHNPAHTALLEM